MDRVLQEIYQSALIPGHQRYLMRCTQAGENEYVIELGDYQLDMHCAEVWVSKIVMNECGMVPHWNIDRRLA